MSNPSPHTDMDKALDHAEGAVGELRCLAHLLNVGVERALDERRGCVERDIVTLHFSTESIRSLKWLSGKVWHALADLDDYLLAAYNARCEAEATGGQHE